MNILISSLGLSAEIVEEALGLFNYRIFDYYRNSSQKGRVEELRKELDLDGHNVDEVWLIATDKRASDKGLRHFNSVQEDFDYLTTCVPRYDVCFRLFVLKGANDINSDAEARAYHSMALEACCMAQKIKGENGRVFVSLAGGRKTMSADLQDAVYCFGCDQLFHILGDSPSEATPIALGSMSANVALHRLHVSRILKQQNPFPLDDRFLQRVEKIKRQTQHFFTTYYLEQNQRSNFPILYTLPPEKIEKLKNEKLGVYKDREPDELAYLRRLPKTELHCHLGGVLSPYEMIEVAKCYLPDIEKEKHRNPAYCAWLLSLPEIKKRLKRESVCWKSWYNNLSQKLHVHKGLIVAPFLLSFVDDPSSLEQEIFGSYLDETQFKGVGIKTYESLGDLQGSALMCNLAAIRQTVRILAENCNRENVKYLEIRCSPINYVKEGITAQQIVDTILSELEHWKDSFHASLIIIASRHGEDSKIRDSIELVRSMRGNALFDHYFRGFDLAGAEEVREAKDLRDLFLEIMRECYNITIHAGETVDSESIWQAVYHLNAERIGHGLSLVENHDLQKKFLERSIGVEMCPSSNFQIKGFRDNYLKSETAYLPQYPLKCYLDYELKVSISTDDPGISRTNITKELLKAARMTEGGLSKWDILQILCNGFQTAFYPYRKKKQLMQETEHVLAQLIENNLL